jgi:division/cell wall cluster transcriptional repressor MraZ
LGTRLKSELRGGDVWDNAEHPASGAYVSRATPSYDVWKALLALWHHEVTAPPSHQVSTGPIACSPRESSVTDPTVSFYRRRLDIRNRTLRLPVALRAVFEGPLVLTITSAQCLAFYRLRRWHAIEDYLMRLPFDQAEDRRLQRLLIGFSTDLTSDARGRYRIPAELLQFAGIRHDVVVALIGTEDGRILDAERWMELAPGGTAAVRATYELNATEH